jgi:hypothetical protein
VHFVGMWQHEAIAIEQPHLVWTFIWFSRTLYLRRSGLLIAKSFNDLTRAWLVGTNKEPDCVKGAAHAPRKLAQTVMERPR